MKKNTIIIACVLGFLFSGVNVFSETIPGASSEQQSKMDNVQLKMKNILKTMKGIIESYRGVLPNEFLDSLGSHLGAETSANTCGENAGGGAGSKSFPRTLQQGDSGDDVKLLQIKLNTDTRTELKGGGPGSPGQETPYFGPLTVSAVMRFQKLYGIEISGYVGEETRQKLEDLFGGGGGGGGNVTITSIDPPNGITGDTITVTGSGFKSSNNQVCAGDIFLSKNSASADGNSIKLTLPKVGYSSGEYEIFVANSEGTSNSIPFTFAANAAIPTIEKIDPSSGIPGTKITIKGTGFETTATNKIFWGNGFRNPIKSSDGKTLTFEVDVPQGADLCLIGSFTGDIMVKNNAGLTESASFTLKRNPEFKCKDDD